MTIAPIFSGFPFVRFSLWLIVGICISYYTDYQVRIPIVLFFIFAFSYGLIALLVSQVYQAKNLLLGVIGAIYLVLLGIEISYRSYPIHSRHHFAHYAEVEAFRATAVTEGERKAFGQKFTAQIQAIRTPSGWQSAYGKLMVQLSDTVLCKYGDEFVVRGQPQSLLPATNPYQFDYRHYLSIQGIYHQISVRKGNFLYIGNRPISPIQEAALQVRRYADSTLKHYVNHQEAYGVVAALLLGVKSWLTDDVRQTYAQAGAMHVLAVSGLHVGILYALITLILGWTKHFSYGKVLKTVIAVALLWCYAFVTGLSPSVLRAVTMFSLVALAQMTNNRSNIYNTIALSAFILLFFNPSLLFQVSFQLSYLAVLGIIYFQPKFYSLFEFENRFTDYLWQITCVALAATLATAPISMYYFGQFPVLFFVSNILVVPLAAFLLVGSLLVVSVGELPWLADVVGFLVKNTVLIQNFLLKGLVSLPYSVVSGIHISELETILFYLVMAGLALHWFHQRRFGIGLALTASATYTIGDAITKYNQANQHKVWVYDIKQGTNVSFIVGGEAFNFADTRLLAHGKTVDNIIRTHQNALNTRQMFFRLDSVLNSPIPYQRLSDGHLWVCQERAIFMPHNESGLFFPANVMLVNSQIKSIPSYLDNSKALYLADVSVKSKHISILKQFFGSDKLISIGERGAVGIDLKSDKYQTSY